MPPSARRLFDSSALAVPSNRPPTRRRPRPSFRAFAAACLVAAGLGAVAVVAPAFAQPPAPPSGTAAKDVENDRGGSLGVTWQISPDETLRVGSVTGYVIQTAKETQGPWGGTDTVSAGTTSKEITGLGNGKDAYLRVLAIGPDGTSAPSPVASARPQASLLNSTRVSAFVILLIYFVFVFFFISSAQAGKALFVRRIPGIDAIEEAIGRATEMGRSVLYVPGISDIDEIQTMASLTILESVAKTVAKYDAPIIVPTTYPVVFTLAQEMVKNGFTSAGRADAYDPDSVRFVTSEQFAYVAAVTGIMLRDKPAANIYMGSFFAESLLLAETGFQTKAIQIAGTAQVAQLPFFVVACDYTLIGEELYAASAYLSREPRLLGSLKGSDLMKVVLILLIIAGCIGETVGWHGLKNWMSTQ